MEKSEVIVFSVADTLSSTQQDEYPVTSAVQDQLARLLRANTRPEVDALFTAIMTAVLNMEILVKDLHLRVLEEGLASRTLYGHLLELEGRVLDAGLLLAPSSHEGPEFPEF